MNVPVTLRAIGAVLVICGHSYAGVAAVKDLSPEFLHLTANPKLFGPSWEVIARVAQAGSGMGGSEPEWLVQRRRKAAAARQAAIEARNERDQEDYLARLNAQRTEEARLVAEAQRIERERAELAAAEARKREEEEARRKAEEEHRIAEAQRLEREKAERLAAEARKREEEEGRRIAAETLKREQDEARRKAEEERKVAEAQRIEREKAERAAADARRREEEDAKRIAAENLKREQDEARRKAEEERKLAEAQRIEREKAERAAAEARKREEEDAKRIAAENLKREQDEARRRAEEERKIAEAQRIERERTERLAVEAKKREEEEGKRTALALAEQPPVANPPAPGVGAIYQDEVSQFAAEQRRLAKQQIERMTPKSDVIAGENEQLGNVDQPPLGKDITISALNPQLLNPSNLPPIMGPVVSPELVKAAQEQLKRLGCYNGQINGDLTPNTTIALQVAEKSQKEPRQPLMPLTDSVVSLLKERKEQLCTGAIRCDAGQQKDRTTCIASIPKQLIPQRPSRDDDEDDEEEQPRRRVRPEARPPRAAPPRQQAVQPAPRAPAAPAPAAPRRPQINLTM